MVVCGEADNSTTDMLLSIKRPIGIHAERRSERKMRKSQQHDQTVAKSAFAFRKITSSAVMSSFIDHFSSTTKASLLTDMNAEVTSATVTEITSDCSDVTDNSIEFELKVPSNTLINRPAVKQLLVQYRSVHDKAETDFFTRLKFIEIRVGNVVLHHLTSTVWGASLFLQNQTLFKNAPESCIYVPLWSDGLQFFDASTHPVKIRMEFSRFDKEDTRVSIMAQFGAAQWPSDSYWTFTRNAFVKMPDASADISKGMDVAIPLLPAGVLSSEAPTRIGQVIFYADDANKWIKNGSLWWDQRETAPTSGGDTWLPMDGNRQVKLLGQFANNYDAVVMDKILHGFPLGKTKPRFTFTFANWTKPDAARELGIQVKGDSFIRLHLDLDQEMPADQRPKDVNLEMFTVVTRSLPAIGMYGC